MWERKDNNRNIRDRFIKKSKYSLFLMIFDYVNFALDLRMKQYNLRWRLHTTLIRRESKKKYQVVLNKLFEEALDYLVVHKDEFEDPMDRQLIEFMRSYIYHKKSQNNA